MGNIKRREDNNNENVNVNNHYFDVILAQILKNIINQNIEINTIEELYKAIGEYSYRKFIKRQKIKEIREFEKRIGYLSKSEFTEMIDILKAKIEKCMKDDKFCEIFSIYFKYYYIWFFKIILESYNYININKYINILIENNDYVTLKVMEKMYSDGIVVKKDESKEKEYKRKSEAFDGKELDELIKEIDTCINDLENDIN